MAIYEFRCREDGAFQVAKPMGGAGPRQPCPTCGRDGARVYGAPMLGLADRRAMAVIDRAEQSRDQPAVVASPPPAVHGRRAARGPQNPALKRLPRP